MDTFSIHHGGRQTIHANPGECTMNDSVITSVYFRRDTVELLDDMVRTKKYASVSKAINVAVHTLNQVERYKTVIKDPVQAAEFQKKIQQIVQEDKVNAWAKSLTKTQLDGFIGFLTMEMERR